MSKLEIGSLRLRRRNGFPRAWLWIAAGLLLVANREIRAEAMRPSETNASFEIRAMVVDGVAVPVQSSAKLRLARQPRTAVFEFGLVTNRIPRAARARFKLDGYEDRWREYPADMRLCLRFLDRNGDQVGETKFKVMGQSEGWTGDPRTSAFTHRRETVVAPPGSRSFWVVMNSAGPPAALGVFAITDLVIRSQSPNAMPPAVSLQDAFESVTGAAASANGPAGWMRDGLRPSMAGVFETPAPNRAKGLVIVDDDLSGHAEWHTVKELASPVTPGERLEVAWAEAYSLGHAGPVGMQYLALPAGYYRFRLNELSVAGVPTEREVSLAFEVPLEFWRTPWFWVSVATTLLGALMGGWRYTIWRRMRFQLLRLEQQRAVDRERLRIAQDIHDDLGARVTQISLLSAVAQRKPLLPDDARADFGIISQTTRELVSALYETVWAVNPENDNLDALASYLCQMANQFCSQAELRCRLEVPDSPPQIALSSHVRHNLIMAVKEALHNVVRHARASEVRIRITCLASVLSVCIQDDGCGFAADTSPPGNGLANLKRRMESIGGSYTLQSRLGLGTTVALTLPLAEARTGSG